LVVLAPKTLGGARLRGELEAFGCEISERSRHHHRICQMRRPDTLRQVAEAITAGGPQRVPSLGLWSQPGLFSWDRLDPGSALLLAQPLRFEGAGVDLGCGAGVLARAALVHDAVTAMTLIDLDRRAMDAARRNLDDPRAHFLQHDLRRPPRGLTGLDFAVMNPPFHDGGVEDRALGRAFAAAAAAMLRAGGRLVMVANVALPFENLLAESFASVRNLARVGGYKVLEANR
jgi:16S rRNA (guanine1207-N2)-methyltransferase